MVIFCENDPALRRGAEQLAERFGLEVSGPSDPEMPGPSGSEPAGRSGRRKREASRPATAERADAGGAETLRLCYEEDGLFLEGNGMRLRADFSAMRRRLGRGELQGELLLRAARIRGLGRPARVLDATAGLGEDALLLAASGCTVDLYEYNPVIAALLADALRRAEEIPELREAAGRMTLHAGDSLEAMRHLAVPPDVIYLDPMFPGRTKSGLIRKKFQLLHLLETPCADEEAMLEAALAAGPLRIVVKRPARGPFLAGRKSSYSVRGNTVRYDCIVPLTNKEIHI